ncbi:hypothetical protein BH09ACT8_BH09ACT8_38330 [soil metagenome]
MSKWPLLPGSTSGSTAPSNNWRRLPTNPSIYVAQAVANRILAETAENDGPSLEQLRDHLVSLGLAASLTPGKTDAVSTELSNPARLRALRQTGLLDSPRELLLIDWH